MLKYLFILLFPPFTALSQTFSEESAAMGVSHMHADSTLMGAGVAIFDFNNDGYEDIYLTGGDERDQLFQNNQNSTFTEVGIAVGIEKTDSIKTSGVTTADIDNDGDRDIFITTGENYGNLLFENNGDGTFTDITITAGILDTSWATSATFGDYNRDGYVDLYVGNYLTYDNDPFYFYMTGGIPNKLYLNNGDNTFSDVSIPSNTGVAGITLCTTFSDYDNDGDVDLFIGNDFGSTLFGGNYLLRNNYPTEDFSDISISSGMLQYLNSMGYAIGDVNEDGWLDYYITDMWYNLLNINNGDHTFNEIGESANVWDSTHVSWGTFFFDYNNDTYLDLFSASGGVMIVAPPQINALFENDATGTLTEVAFAEGIQDTCRSRGAAYGDLDNDGDLDIVVNNIDHTTDTLERASVYQNNLSNGNNWVALRLEGTISHRDAFGAHVYVYSNGRTFIREVDGGSSYMSQNSSVIHVGLGAEDLDSVVIHWPSGYVQHETGLPQNAISTVVENDFTSLDETEQFEWSLYPNPASGTLHCFVKHGEINELSLVTLDGKIVFRSTPGTSSTSLDVSNFEPAIYLLHIQTDKGTSTRKVRIY